MDSQKTSRNIIKVAGSFVSLILFTALVYFGKILYLIIFSNKLIIYEKIIMALGYLMFLALFIVISGLTYKSFKN